MASATGTLLARVLDPLVAGVDGTWRIHGDGARPAVERTDGAPDVTLGMDLLASLALYGSARRLAAAGRLAGTSTTLDELDRLLA